MTKYCPGCGSKLQNDKPNEIGYIPANTKNKAKLCERCFKIIHYNETIAINNDNITKDLLNEINLKNSFVFFLIDFLNINEETIGIFNKIKTKKALIVSKCDIIPRSIKEQKIIQWLNNVYQVKTDIFFVSTKNNYNINLIPNIMEELWLDEAYILGFTNAGKSSLINKLYEKILNKKPTITTSNIPNTTIDSIVININDLKIIDTPGFGLKINIYDEYPILMRKTSIDTFIKPITYQLKSGMSVIIEDLFRFEYLSDDKNSMTFYISSKLDIDRIFENNDTLTSLDSKVFNVPSNHDIVIKGIGFANIKKDCSIKIYSKYSDLIEIRKSIF